MLFSAGVLLTTVLLQDNPAATDSTSRSRLTALPVVSYSDVTGIQYGATAFFGFKASADTITRASSLSAYASRTAKGHAKWYAQLDRWSANNSTHQRLRVEYISYPLPFFGFGANSPDSAEEWYSSGVTTVQHFTQFRVKGPLYLHSGLKVVLSRMREYEPDGLLTLDDTPGSNGSSYLVTEFGLVIDSRDNIGAPRRGSYVRVIPSLLAAGLHSVASRTTIDARQYIRVGNNHVAAFQLQYDGIPETTPFDLMPMIGADHAMRAYALGRFRDQHAFTAQGEFRTGYLRRTGVVAFAGAGTVAQELSQLRGGTWYPSVGAGLRYLLVPKDRTVARLDLGIGRGSFGLTVGIGEAF